MRLLVRTRRYRATLSKWLQVTSRPVGGGANRAAVLRLLGRARDSYSLRSGGSAGRGYDLKVIFTVNSGGQTEYDGAWEMEDVFDPKQGLRWTAKVSGAVSGAYAISRISSNGMLYGEETGSYIPLRLQEARAALFDPIPASGNVARSSIRTSDAVFNGTQLTCILLSASGKAANAAEGRRGTKPRSVSILSPGCSGCIRKYRGATMPTITRTPRSLMVTYCLAG